MELFKKLQENSLYWRYRFITRRYLALKRWWRELRQPNTRRVRVVRQVPRGMASFDPYGMSRRSASGGVNAVRGVAFVLVAAAVWTILARSAVGAGSFPIELFQFGSLALLAYLFVRFW